MFEFEIATIFNLNLSEYYHHTEIWTLYPMQILLKNEQTTEDYELLRVKRKQWNTRAKNRLLSIRWKSLIRYFSFIGNGAKILQIIWFPHHWINSIEILYIYIFLFWPQFRPFTKFLILAGLTPQNLSNSINTFLQTFKILHTFISYVCR